MKENNRNKGINKPGAGPPYGNLNAEKWTLNKAIKLFNDAIALSNEKEIFDFGMGGKKEGFKYDFIGEVARDLGTYHTMMTQHLIERFPELEKLKKQLISNLEANCYLNTKKGCIREATGIVNLKSNHKWQDRTVVAGDKDNPLIQKELTDEERKIEIEKLRKKLLD